MLDVAYHREPRPILEVTLLEGPAAHKDGFVVFSDIPGDRIFRADITIGLGEMSAGVLLPASTQYSILRSPSRRANGNAFDPQGRLVTCEGAEHGAGGGRRLVRKRSGLDDLEVLLDSYRGRRLNSPNDLTIDDQGRIYFTDPRYGDRSDIELDAEAVYRIDPDGSVDQIIAQPVVERPNGIAVRPDGRELYVVDSAYDRPDGARRIWAFELNADGRPVTHRLVYDFGAGRGGDGMAVDVSGTLYVCAGIRQPRSKNESTDVKPGVYRMTTDGQLLDFMPVPVDLITNCCFGGSDMRTLFITAGHRLFATQVDVPGWHAWRWGPS